MTPLIVVLGIVGAILILVGLVGGNFTVSGSIMPKIAMPKVGNWVRLPCFSVGAVLVVVAIGMGAVYNPIPSSAAEKKPPTPTPTATISATPTSPSPSPSQSASQSASQGPSQGPSRSASQSASQSDNPSPEYATGIVVAPQGDSAVYVYEQPSGSSTEVAEVADGATISILCTAQGDVVTNSDSGQTSSLWDGTSDGFIPDVYVDTGTNQATMGSC